MTLGMPPPITDLEKRREQLSHQLASIGEMRPGSLVERYRKCGKPNCRCAQPGDPGHGPSYSLTRQVGGKTVTRIIPPGEEAERAKAQIAEYRRFRGLTREMVEVSEQLCQARLGTVREEAAAAAQKRGSKKGSKRKSNRK